MCLGRCECESVFLLWVDFRTSCDFRGVSTTTDSKSFRMCFIWTLFSYNVEERRGKVLPPFLYTDLYSLFSHVTHSVSNAALGLGITWEWELYFTHAGYACLYCIRAAVRARERERRKKKDFCWREWKTKNERVCSGERKEGKTRKRGETST